MPKFMDVHRSMKGITAEACRVVVDSVFANHGPRRIQARVIVGNDASVRVLEKIGFQLEGTLRSSLLRRGKFAALTCDTQ